MSKGARPCAPTTPYTRAVAALVNNGLALAAPRATDPNGVGREAVLAAPSRIELRRAG